MDEFIQIYSMTKVERYFNDYDWDKKVESIKKALRRISANERPTARIQCTNNTVLLVSDDCIYKVLIVFDDIDIMKVRSYYKFFEKKILELLPYNGVNNWDFRKR